jgi:hypothetical protein
MRKIRIGNVEETVVERSDYPPERIRAILGDETIAVLGYGVQGRGQSLNMRDNGLNVIIGLREKGGRSWDLAVQDGWVPGKTLFSLRRSGPAWHDHPVFAFRCGTERAVAGDSSAPDPRKGPVFFARV